MNSRTASVSTLPACRRPTCPIPGVYKSHDGQDCCADHLPALPMPAGDIDAVLHVCLGHELASSAPRIVDEEYESGVPGRACLDCSSAWPASESDDESWHHAQGCASGAT